MGRKEKYRIVPYSPFTIPERNDWEFDARKFVVQHRKYGIWFTLRAPILRDTDLKYENIIFDTQKKAEAYIKGIGGQIVDTFIELK
jgi:hypothetical protein